MDGLVIVPCLICKNQLISPKSVLRERTLYTRTLFVTKLSRIVRKKLESCSLPQADICGTCQSLLNLIDEHESKLLAYENEVRLKFKLPFPIILEDKNESAPPPFDDQPIAEPQMGGLASSELEAGPDDVIVSADDTGLVTVTYSQPDDGTEAGRPPGATSPAVIWDGDSDQQIIIFKEEEMAPVVDLLEDLVPAEPPLVKAAVRPPGAANQPPPLPPPPPPPLPPAEPPRLFFCDICDVSFSSTDVLAGHRATHDRLRFTCEFCSERCATTVSLSQHMNLLHADRLLPCDRCQKRFATRAGLTQHAKQHEARQHACPLCPRRFVSLHDLQLHSAFKHSDARPFSCDICRRTFKTASMVRRHKLRHTGLKPHTCPQCGMAFTHKFAMESHAATHQSRQLQCDTCGKKFGLERSLALHVRLMHTEGALPR